MISRHEARTTLLVLVDGYLGGSVSGRTLVKTVDDLVGNDIAAELPPALRELTLAFQERLALYVADAQTRLESDAYFGDEELSQKAKTFRALIAADESDG